MTKLSIYDFSVGDIVYHLSNVELKMIVIEVGDALENQQITCRWMDKDGISHKEKFLPEELAK